MNKLQAAYKRINLRHLGFGVCITAVVVLSGCRYDMQDQPKYKSYREMKDGIGSRSPVDGTVFRNNLREDKALYTGKTDVPSTEVPQTAVDSRGSAVVTTFPGAIDFFPIPVDEKTVEKGEERYKVFCGVCHGALGKGDGMIIRRGFSPPPTYHDNRLRNAPVGHFFDVITNGYGKMNGYAAQIPVEDRWAIVAYIRALQISQNPNGANSGTMNPAVVPTSKPQSDPKATEVKPVLKTDMPANKPATANTAATEKGGKK